MPSLEIGENWIWQVWGERIGPCNNSGGGRAGTETAVIEKNNHQEAIKSQESHTQAKILLRKFPLPKTNISPIGVDKLTKTFRLPNSLYILQT